MFRLNAQKTIRRKSKKTFGRERPGAHSRGRPYTTIDSVRTLSLLITTKTKTDDKSVVYGKRRVRRLLERHGGGGGRVYVQSTHAIVCRAVGPESTFPLRHAIYRRRVQLKKNPRDATEIHAVRWFSCICFE